MHAERKKRTTVGDLLFGGTLVSFPVTARRNLDGFWRTGRIRRPHLLVYVHGMHSNFFASRLKKEVMALAERGPADVLLFNTRGAGSDTEDERFSAARADIGAALSFGRRRGYRRFFLAGHSTGCQKCVYFLARARPSDVRGVALLAPCDDYAITRRTLGRHFPERARRAAALVAAGRGEERMPEDCLRFSARRFLSLADRRRAEAALFDYDGPMRAFRRLSLPLLVLFGTREEYACLPVRTMMERLADRTGSPDFNGVLLRRADHGFHGHEQAAAEELRAWMTAQGA